VLDVDKDSYLSQKEFLAGMLNFYCSSFDQKLKLVFNMYDFDDDGLISKVDITTLISCMPMSTHNNIRGEGRYTTEGGGV
jgi:Ca2+-binding EF-hand superfamily protein